eukprot:3940895-Rhodomonas_salina.11
MAFRALTRAGACISAFIFDGCVDPLLQKPVGQREEAQPGWRRALWRSLALRPLPCSLPWHA